MPVPATRSNAANPKGNGLIACAEPILSMRDLASLTGCGYFAMFIRGYIDDSADQSKEIAAVAGAVLGDDRQWDRLTREWQERLDQEGVKYYRSTSLKSWRGPFFCYQDRSRYSVEQAREAEKKIRADLQAILRDSGVMGFAHYIPLEMYKRVRANVPMAAKVFPDDPFIPAIQSLVRDCAKEFRVHYGSEHQLAFVCDDGSSSHIILDVYKLFKRNNPDFGDLIGPLTFADDKVTPPLQAADMMAGIARDFAQEHLVKGATAHQGPLNSSIYFVRHWSERIMLDILDYQLRTAHERVSDDL